MERRVRMTYDPDADAAYLHVTEPIEPGAPVTQRVLDHGTPRASVVVDFDSDGRLLGVELLGVSALLRPDAVPRGGPVTRSRRHQGAVAA